MADVAQKRDYLTPGELVERWRGAVTPKTLANWRSLGRGPAWVQLGRQARYPVRSVEAFEAARMTSKR